MFHQASRNSFELSQDPDIVPSGVNTGRGLMNQIKLDRKFHPVIVFSFVAKRPSQQYFSHRELLREKIGHNRWGKTTINTHTTYAQVHIYFIW